ncbi:MAG: hypothetical protein V3T23_02840 [Nitrososphaerales archaeon]
MSLNFFEVARGLSLDGNVEIIGTSGAPVGVEADAVGKGALAIDFLNGALYQKGDSGTGPELWQSIGADSNWRGESEVRDGSATVLPTFTPATDATVDGETIVDQERVLFSALTVNPNIYIYDRSAGVFLESTNEASNGDTTFIVRGTDAGKKYLFNGTVWVQNDQASADELAFIRTFIGKTAAGSETPTYSSNNIVTDATSLETAIGDLDAALAVGNVSTTQVGVSTISTQDSVLVDSVASVQWLVTARQGTSMNSRVVWASHDGTTGSDAVDTDHTEFAKIKKNAVIAGLTVDVDLSGAGAAQVMRLRVATTAAADWHATRMPVNF